MAGLFGSNQKSSIMGEDPAPTQFMSNSNSAKMFTPRRESGLLPDTSTYGHSKLNLLDDLLQETFAQKQSLSDTNHELLDRYLDAFQNKILQAKAKRK